MASGAIQTTSLWQHGNFLRLWISETVSSFGSQFSGVAIPLTAVYVLHVNSFEQGILFAAGTAPFLLFGLLVGVWVDRHNRRPIMVFSNICRGLLLGGIPLAFLAGVLSLPLLAVVSFLVGVLTVFFDVAYQAYLPSLVERGQLTDANSKLEASRATSQVVGPGVAGAVVDIISRPLAPLAVGVDAFSFFGSALSLGRIRHQEEMQRSVERPSVMTDLREGLSVVFRDERLRSIAGCTSTANFFSSALFPVAILYMTDPDLSAQGSGLGLSAFAFGLTFAVGAVGGLGGALYARPFAKRVGLGYAIIASTFIGGVGAFSFYIATPSLSVPLGSIFGFAVSYSLLVLMGGALITFFATVVYNVNQVSLRQAIVPLRLQGRMNATMRFLVWGTLPLGALAGGILGVIIGIRPTILFSAIGGSLAFLWVLFSPVRHLKEIPEPMS